MNKDRIVVVLNLYRQKRSFDIDIPLDISANELIIGLNTAFNLNIDLSDLSKCYLKSENPIAFLKGNKLLSEYGLWNGSIINII